MSRAVLSIGSNLGDRLGHLNVALRALRPWLVAVSPVYRTHPWGPVEQDDFLNAVLVADDAQASPDVWLRRAQSAEQEADRVRDIRWGPRTLDVDVIAVDDVRSDDPALTLPHPRAAARAFVLVPWLAVDPDAELPQGPVAQLLAALGPDELAAVQIRPDLVLG